MGLNIDLHAGSLHEQIIVCRSKYIGDKDQVSYAIQIEDKDLLWDIYCNDLNLSACDKDKIYRIKSMIHDFKTSKVWEISPANWVDDVRKIVRSNYNKELNL